MCPRLQPRQFSLILPSSNGCKPVNYGNYCLPAGLDSTGRQSHQDHPRPPLFIRLSPSSCVGAGVKRREFHKHDAGPGFGFAASRPSRHATIRWHPLPLLCFPHVFFRSLALHGSTVHRLSIRGPHRLRALIKVAFVSTPQSPRFAWEEATRDHKEHYRRNLLQIVPRSFFFFLLNVY